MIIHLLLLVLSRLFLFYSPAVLIWCLYDWSLRLVSKEAYIKPTSDHSLQLKLILNDKRSWWWLGCDSKTSSWHDNEQNLTKKEETQVSCSGFDVLILKESRQEDVETFLLLFHSCLSWFDLLVHQLHDSDALSNDVKNGNTTCEGGCDAYSPFANQDVLFLTNRPRTFSRRRFL